MLGQGWNGDMRRIRDARKKQGDITAVLPTGNTERWADNWMILNDAPHPLAAHAWINKILDPNRSGRGGVPQLPRADPQGDGSLPPALRNDPLFNVPADVHR